MTAEVCHRNAEASHWIFGLRGDLLLSTPLRTLARSSLGERSVQSAPQVRCRRAQALPSKNALSHWRLLRGFDRHYPKSREEGVQESRGGSRQHLRRSQLATLLRRARLRYGNRIRAAAGRRSRVADLAPRANALNDFMIKELIVALLKALFNRAFQILQIEQHVRALKLREIV